MTKGYVYLFTNPCMPGWVKIGTTDKPVAERAKELSQPTGVPLSFRVYAFLETENASQVEHSIHKIIDTVDAELHAREELAGGGVRSREFFDMSPAAAYAVFEQVAALLGGSASAKLTKVESTGKERAAEEIEEKIADQAIRRSRKGDEQSFFQQMKDNVSAGTISDGTLQAIRKLYDWSLKNADETRFGTGDCGSFNPQFKEPIGSPFSAWTNGTLQMKYAWHPETSQRLCDTLAAKGVFTLQKGQTTADSKPIIPADYVTEKVDAIIDALNEFVASFPPKE